MPNNAASLSAVLNGRYFVVPDYQRPYAWERAQLEDLWQDIDLMTEGSRHYTGTLVLKEHDEEIVDDAGASLTRSDVVDGQQRLTTCLILIDQLRRALLRVDDEMARTRADGLARTFGPLAVGGLPRARLQLGPDLNDYWVEVILGDGQQSTTTLIPGERRLRDAARFFEERIAELHTGLPAAEGLAVLQELQKRVTNGLRFLVYEVEQGSHAGEIFESLNDRGRDLTEMEKIKNYLLFLATSLPNASSGALSERINRTWSEIYRLLASCDADENTLLRSHWLATYQPMARHWAGATSVKQRFAREIYIPGSSRLTRTDASAQTNATDLQARLVTEINDYLTSLRDCALFTTEFLTPNATFQSFGDDPVVQAEARASSARLRRSGVTAVFRPLLFAARLRHPTNGAYYADLLEACESYSARVFVIGQKRSNSGQARLYRLAHELYLGADPHDIVSEIRAMTWYYADDDVVRSAFAANQQWYWRTHGHKFVLYEYELEKARRESDVRDFSTYTAGKRGARTTEHVLPQSPDWESGDWSAFTPEEHAELVHGIGNLVLTDDNSSYGRRSFASKKGTSNQPTPCYASSRLAQELELADYDDWTPQTINERRERLMEWALIRWPAAAPHEPTANLATDDETDEADSTEHEDAAIRATDDPEVAAP